ncbi:MAG: transposase [Planctomycetota bacterium]
MDEPGVAPGWRMPDSTWKRIECMVPQWRRHPGGGRPWVGQRKIADGIFFALRTGCQWKAVPREFGSGSTLHRERGRRATDAPVNGCAGARGS